MVFRLFQSWCILLCGHSWVESRGLFVESDIYNSPCSIRFEHRKILKQRFIGCQALVQRNPICGENISVSYMEYPPYVFKENNKTKGILPGMLKFALDTCCFGCNRITYIGPLDHVQLLEDENSTLVMPVQSSTYTNSYMGHPFVPMVEIKEVMFLGPVIKHDPKKTALLLLKSILNTWPLFVTALAMAITAGICIWLLDAKLNKSDFPLSFPRGPFEGFWWAFVSMTTVGYGDRKPKSVCARLFAVVWILVGMTIFSMYTASLSSALTSSIISSHKISMFQKKIGVLHASTAGKLGTIRENAKSIEFENLLDIKRAMKTKQIDGIGLDENVANFYMEDMINMDDIQLYYRSTLTGISHGLLSRQHDVTKLLISFYESNKDMIDVMAKESIDDIHDEDHILLETPVYEANQYFSSKSPLFPETLLALLIICIISTSFALCLKWLVYKRCKKDGRNKRKDKHIVDSHVFLLINDLHEYTSKAKILHQDNNCADDEMQICCKC